MSEAVHELSRADARRLAVRAQLLDAERPGSVLEVVRGLTMLQLEPTAAVAPNADLVLWSRLGAAYDPAELTALRDDLTLVELRGELRPQEDLALHRAEMAAWPGTHELRPWEHELVDWVDANESCRLDLLARLRSDAPLPTSELPDSCEVPWRSRGWTNGKNVARLLDQMVQRGEVAVVGRERGQRLWDLAERVYLDDPVADPAEAQQRCDARRLRSLGIVRASRRQAHHEPTVVGEAGEAAVVEGVRGRWRVDPALLAAPFTGRTALLSPLDRLVFDRKRMLDLFDFDYQLEMYKPKAKRRWGYYALPVLHGDRLVGKLDATADRAEGVLRVDAVHEDAPFDAPTRDAVDAEIDDLATWLGLEVVRS